MDMSSNQFMKPTLKLFASTPSLLQNASNVIARARCRGYLALVRSMSAATSQAIIGAIVIAFAHQGLSQSEATAVPSVSCSGRCIVPVTWVESFDSVIPPALPLGWVATNGQGPSPLWVTSNSGVPIPPVDTFPNAAFVDDPAVVSDKRLDSLPNPLPPADSLQLTFRHNFNLEASDMDPTLGFDGGVLELSTDGGNTFRDILAAGGSFVAGGYNRTIGTDRGNPIAGRQAWSGNSNGFITTVIDLPIVSPPGFTLRWRMASDTSGTSEGWRVDTINVVGCAPIPCQTPTPLPRPTARARPTPWPRP
jgi:hypothetical protein